MEDEKVFFLPGETVEIKQKLFYVPKMVVIGKVTKMIRPIEGEDKKSFLQGIKCFWFTENGEYQEAAFNTKDLKHC